MVFISKKTEDSAPNIYSVTNYKFYNERRPGGDHFPADYDIGIITKDISGVEEKICLTTVEGYTMVTLKMRMIALKLNNKKTICLDFNII